MNQPFEVADENVAINGSIIVGADRFAVSGEGFPEEFGRVGQEKVDLLERRLSRLEKVLDLDSTCDD